MTCFKDYRVGHMDEPYCIGSKLCLLTCWHLACLYLDLHYLGIGIGPQLILALNEEVDIVLIWD